jgi:energy-coupling factor transport system ATP-binding protein
LVAGSLETVELTGLEDADPFSLTRGQRQRVALAAILACEPGIIVFDEPTTGLDIPQQEAMMQLLDTLRRQGHTVVMVTHHTEMALRHARRLILLREGRVLADGPTRDVVADRSAFESASQSIPPTVEIAMDLFGVPLLSAGEFKKYVRLS